MAEKSKAKRQVKNPETFRERAVKATEAKGRQSRPSKLKNNGAKTLRPVLQPVGTFSSGLWNQKSLRPLKKLFSLIGKVIFPVYFRRSWKELRQVSWPSWKQSRQLTVAVLGFAIVFGAAIALVDYGLDKVFKQVLLK